MPQLTQHSIERGKERLGLNRKALGRLATKAFALGRLHTDFKGQLRCFMDVLIAKHTAKNLRVYGEHIYVFGGEDLVTVLQIPQDLRRHLK